MMDKKYLIPKIKQHSAISPANQLAGQLTWLIADGVITKGEKLPSIRDYAKVLHIHHHTVRAAYHKLEESHLVSMRPGTGTIAREYFPFISTPYEAFLDQEMIAILIPRLSEFYQNIIFGIESATDEKRLIPIILSCHNNPIYAEAIYNILSARNIKGIINISIGFTDEFYEKFLKIENLNIPLVFLDVVEAESHSLTIDTAAAIELATGHLIDHGYADLALLNCPSDWPIGREAIKGFRSALQSKGFTQQEKSIFTVPGFGYDAGHFIIERMLNNQELPRGIVTVSDELAIGAISALKDNGFRVPQDVAIIGFDDIPSASFIDPPLTTVSLPLFEMGQQTMLALGNVLNGYLEDWFHKSFSGRLVVRESCGCH
jgi:DNA-binding LacI/PurR family transcriptional regulator